MMKISARAEQIPSFLVMDVMSQAKELERQGIDVVHMEVGEPDWPAPPHVKEAVSRALTEQKTRYTVTEGSLELRNAISHRYESRYGVQVDPERIVVTMGTSPALFLIWGALLENGDEVLLTDPHYACYPGTVEFMGGRAVRVPLSPETGFGLDLDQLKKRLGPRTRAVLVNSPSNPTGMILEPEALEAMAGLEDVVVISDEIYHELEYGPARARSILEFTSNAFVMDGFSKRYCMTGLRLGWLVVPEPFIRAVRKIHQNFFISAAQPVQQAGIAALNGPQDALARMVETFDDRRRFLIDALRKLGFHLPVEPMGAFYVLADARCFKMDSVTLARKILDEAHVAVTPGVDFGEQAEGFLRFSYCQSLDKIKEGMRRLEEFCARHD